MDLWDSLPIEWPDSLERELGSLDPLDDQFNGRHVHMVNFQLVLCGKAIVWQNNVRIFLRWFNILLETWLDELLILLE